MANKVAPKTSRETKLLTEAELEMMQALWKLGRGSVHDVQDALKAHNKELAYTSVATILRILEQKKFLSSVKEGRGHVYVPSLTRESYEARHVDDVIDRVFEGAPQALVSRLLGSGRVDRNEIAAIRKLLEAAEGQDG